MFHAHETWFHSCLPNRHKSKHMYAHEHAHTNLTTATPPHFWRQDCHPLYILDIWDIISFPRKFWFIEPSKQDQRKPHGAIGTLVRPWWTKLDLSQKISREDSLFSIMGISGIPSCFCNVWGELSLVSSKEHPGGYRIPSGFSNKLLLPASSGPLRTTQVPWFLWITAGPWLWNHRALENEKLLTPWGSSVVKILHRFSGDQFSSCLVTSWHEFQVIQRLASEVLLNMKCNSRQWNNSANTCYFAMHQAVR